MLRACPLLLFFCVRERRVLRHGGGLVGRKVVAESEQVFGTDVPLAGPLPSIEELRGLQFTEACLRETLRKYRYYHNVTPLLYTTCCFVGNVNDLRARYIASTGWWLIFLAPELLLSYHM